MAKKQVRKKVRKQKRRPQSRERDIPWQKIFGWGLLILSLGLIAYWRYQLIEIPLDRDEGTYYILGKMISDGAVPYAEAYEMKPPGILYLYALIWIIFGGSISGLHLGLLAFSLGSMILIFFWARYLMDEVSAGISSFALGLFTLAPRMSGYATVSEHFLIFFIIASFFTLFHGLKRRNQWMFFISGLLMASALSIKQNGLFFLPVALLTPLLYDGLKRKNWFQPSTGISLLWFCGGGISLALLFALVLLFQGALDDFWYWNYTYPRIEYTAAIPLERGLEFFQTYFKALSSFNSFLWIGAGLGLISLWFRSTRRFEAFFLTLFALASFASIIPGLRFYGHYWIFLGPAAGLLYGSLVHELPNILPNRKTVHIGRTALVLITAVLSGIHVFQNTDYYIEPQEAVVLRRTYGNNPFFEMHKIGERLNRTMPEDTEVVVFGSEAELYVQTQLDPPSNHVFMSFLAKEHRRKEQFIREFQNDVEQVDPEVAILVNHPYSWSITARDDQTIYQWCYRYFHQNYTVVGVVDIYPASASDIDFTGRRTEPKSEHYLLVGLRNDLLETQSPAPSN